MFFELGAKKMPGSDSTFCSTHLGLQQAFLNVVSSTCKQRQVFGDRLVDWQLLCTHILTETYVYINNKYTTYDFLIYCNFKSDLSIKMWTFCSCVRSLCIIFHSSSVKCAPSDRVQVLLLTEKSLSGIFTQLLTGPCWNLGMLPSCRVNQVTDKIAKILQYTVPIFYRNASNSLQRKIHFSSPLCLIINKWLEHLNMPQMNDQTLSSTQFSPL